LGGTLFEHNGWHAADRGVSARAVVEDFDEVEDGQFRPRWVSNRRCGWAQNNSVSKVAKNDSAIELS
jgi:hypothetical protein